MARSRNSQSKNNDYDFFVSDWESSSSSDSSDYGDSSNIDDSDEDEDDSDDDEDEDEDEDDHEERPPKCSSGSVISQTRHAIAADGVAVSNLLWPANKYCLKVQFLDGDSWHRDTVEYFVKTHYHAVNMRIRFEFLKKGVPGPSDIRITFVGWAASYIGRDAENFPGQPTMWLNLHRDYSSMSPEYRRLKRQADILHEFGHALGMDHEQKHPDYKVNWNYRVLQARFGWDAARVHNAYDKHGTGRVRSAPYDRDSIMHYPVLKGDTLSGVQEVPMNSVLSEGDKKFLAAIYPAAGVTKLPTKHKPPKVSTRRQEKKPEKKLQVVPYSKHQLPKDRFTSIIGGPNVMVAVGFGNGGFFSGVAVSGSSSTSVVSQKRRRYCIASNSGIYGQILNCDMWYARII
ncbi:hypothetical protein DL762_006476 [Monosporascus cannonballus]|uniref:Peptidase M12A domain-containing protein n=1 Tax=Monosporascus cannonballus TaxID=155416 RepID=A0ABY0H6I6_9PEZI|nr:hypothetical protein DL762_006476 [Monosporascus cannonballus]